MPILDLFIGGIIIFGFIRGYRKGVLLQFASIFAIIVGIFGAINYAEDLSGIIQQKVEMPEKYIGIVSFIITFLLIVIAIHLIARLLNKLIKAIDLAWLNNILGGVFGAAKLVLFLSIIFVIINHLDKNQKILSAELKQESVLHKPTQNFSILLFPSLEEYINGYEDKLLNEN